MNEHDYVVEYLTDTEEKYSKFRDAYNIHAVHLSNRQNMITLPLLVITSATGVIASLEINRVIGIIVGASSAVLTAVQRYCSYSERSENARMTAKSYSKIINKIENMRLSINSKVITAVSQEMFSKFIREIQSVANSARENAMEVPWELLKYIDTVDARVGCSITRGKIQVPGRSRPSDRGNFQVKMAGRVWTIAEETQLLNEIESGVEVWTICNSHRRTHGAITSRKRKMAACFYEMGIPITEISRRLAMTEKNVVRALDRRGLLQDQPKTREIATQTDRDTEHLNIK